MCLPNSVDILSAAYADPVPAPGAHIEPWRYPGRESGGRHFEWSSCASSPGSPPRVPDRRPTAGERANGSEPGADLAWRVRGRQVGAVGVPGGKGIGMSRRASGGRRVRDDASHMQVCIRFAARCLIFGSACPLRSAMHSRRRSACARDRHPIPLSSVWPYSVCCLRSLGSVRSSVWSTMHSGWTLRQPWLSRSLSRRLLVNSIGLVFAVPESWELPEFSGFPELAVSGLNAGDARALLESVLPGRMDERVRDRIVSESHGNPLTLLDVGNRVAPVELAGGFALPDVMPSVNRIEQTFVRRLEMLPVESRRLLLIAATEARRRSELLVARGWAARAWSRCGCAGAGCRIDRYRRPRPVQSSSVALGGLPWRVCARSLGGASGAGRGDRSRGRCRPPSMAPGARGGRTGRRGRRRTRALGRLGGGSGRRRGGRGIPRKGDRIDTGSCPPSAACAQGRTGQAPGRRVRAGDCDACYRGGWTAR